MLNNSYNSNGETGNVYTIAVEKVMLSDYFKNRDFGREEGKLY
jgi:hypothetical protein